MDHLPQPIDEYTLAAFLAGSLPESQRQEVICYLAQHADARELLHMASEALEASQGTGTPTCSEASVKQPVERQPLATTPARRAPARETRRRDRMHGMGVSRYLAAAVVIFAVGLSLRLAIGPPTDELRSARTEYGPTQLAVEVPASDLQITWTEIPGTYTYRLLIFDPQEVRTVARYETKTPHLDAAQARDLKTSLAAGRAYSAIVDAIDTQNRIIQSSESVTFTVGE